VDNLARTLATQLLKAHSKNSKGFTHLVETELPISEVALATGFSSHSHFATAFKKKVGLSPKAYRHEKGAAVQHSAISFSAQPMLA
jgi:AraC-like DNA-binding protein